ncbi:N-acetyltransferase [Rhizobium acidisoli]|uniref:N-acetyltransferase n=1 Tax=Rhizobium acidisoli TaxID=1538158 RepID=A0AAE5TVS2_9HYPH|nr:GNAT family N-acetyltransferase [Rhizobium acidisoli]QAS78762.1 N-acetyltransferase [Rhizobium acidisoli]
MVVTEDRAAPISSPLTAQPTPSFPLVNRELETLRFIRGLSEDYPDIQNWYISKVVPGLRLGTRFLLPVHRNGELVAVGIAKNDGLERKICTVRVAPHHAGRGLGLRVFDGLLKWLDDDQPGLTVSGTKLPAFERIFDWYGFKFTGVENDVYVRGRQEFGYNDAIFANNSFSNKILEPIYDKPSIALAKSTR